MTGNLASRVMLPRFFLIFLLTWQGTISNSNISSSATVAQHNSHQHSPSFQWIQIVSQRIEVVSQSWLDDRTPLVHIDIDRDRCAISCILFHIFILPTCCQTFFSRMFSSDKPQGPSRFQSPGIQGKRVPRPGSRMARGPDQVKKSQRRLPSPGRGRGTP